MPENNPNIEDSMETTKIAEFIGSVSSELKNSNKLMGQLQEGQEALKDQIGDVKSDIQVMKASSDLKRNRCDEIFDEHTKKMIDLEDRSRRDKIMLNDLEKRLSLDDTKDQTKKEVITEQRVGKQDRREITVFQMGIVLFAIQLASFIILIVWKK